jgi:hypothetical protein
LEPLSRASACLACWRSGTEAGGTVTVSSYVFPEANPIFLTTSAACDAVSCDMSYIAKSNKQNLIE